MARWNVSEYSGEDSTDDMDYQSRDSDRYDSLWDDDLPGDATDPVYAYGDTDDITTTYEVELSSELRRELIREIAWRA